MHYWIIQRGRVIPGTLSIADIANKCFNPNVVNVPQKGKLNCVSSEKQLSLKHKNFNALIVPKKNSLVFTNKEKLSREPQAGKCQATSAGGFQTKDERENIAEENGAIDICGENNGAIINEEKAEMLTEKKTLRVMEGNGAIRTSRQRSLINKVENHGLRMVHTEPGSIRDHMEHMLELLRPDGGPPRWFCPLDCGQPAESAPVLLFLPGIDGTGLGLIVHHKSLGELFNVCCLHIPVKDRTSTKGLIEIVEEKLKVERSRSPSMPIYIVGESLGAALALAVAARNPNVDLLLVLVNPGTSFKDSQIQPFLPLLDILPDQPVSFLLNFIMGDPIQVSLARVKGTLPPLENLEQLSSILVSLIPIFSTLADIVPKETLSWRLRLLRSVSTFANSHLHAVRAEVLVLASGKDWLLPSVNEAKRLQTMLQKCTVRYFQDRGHRLLLEEDINLANVIRGAKFYRQSKAFDFVLDFLYPTTMDFAKLDEQTRFIRQLSSPVFFSTKDDGRVAKGLGGVPKEQQILLVGNHMLMGLELSIIVNEFLKQQNRVVRGIAHPILFSMEMEGWLTESGLYDNVRLFGGVPATKRNFLRVLARGESVLLYPGGVREALHRKGEAYELFWPQQSEFVRAASRFGVTIVPFGVVGEDDILEILLDYNDLMKIPAYHDFFDAFNKKITRLRTNSVGEVANQDLHLPLLAPRPPGRMYILFGRPFPTTGKCDLDDRSKSQQLYMQVKLEVEACLKYLQEKRLKDPFRSFFPRFVHETLLGGHSQAPTFEV